MVKYFRSMKFYIEIIDETKAITNASVISSYSLIKLMGNETHGKVFYGIGRHIIVLKYLVDKRLCKS